MTQQRYSKADRMRKCRQSNTFAQSFSRLVEFREKVLVVPLP